jgi:hypothetical protein
MAANELEKAQNLIDELEAIHDDRRAAHFDVVAQRHLRERAEVIRRKLAAMGVVVPPSVG